MEWGTGTVVFFGLFSELFCYSSCIQKVTKFNDLIMQKATVFMILPTKWYLSYAKYGIRNN